MDENFWKRAYSPTWAAAGRRERRIAEEIFEATGREVVPAGLGTGSTDFLPGAAERHGHERGAPDLQVAGTNIFIEVTGPLASGISAARPLWLRPDKIEHARRHLQQMRTVVIHCLGASGARRVLYLGPRFFARLAACEFPTVRPVIGSRREHYIAIPAEARGIFTWEQFLGRLASSSRLE